MTLLLTMLPFYLFGNLHCLGMCGPLVMMLGKHRYRYFYFLGRLISYALAGMVAGEVGAILQITLSYYHLSAMVSFVFGGLIGMISITTIRGWRYPGYDFFSKRLAKINNTLSLLMLRDEAWPAFLFGFFTLLLPCGQTVIVFSACALVGDPWVGGINGCVFALLTSPSLFMAMQAHRLFHPLKKHYNQVIGVFGLIVGVLAICRGLAELQWIPHLVLNPSAHAHYHLVIY